ncbi:MAG TPA: hypothetical protein VIX58_07435, partial [Anaerolineae bacterium]
IRREYDRLRSPSGDDSTQVKLTPAALARLYLIEELYQPARQELDVLVRDDPTRFDLRVALAETLFRLGHLRECAKEAQEILTTLPFCVKANLLLGYAWVESGVREGEVYMKRAREIDPEGIFARYLFGDRTLIKFEKPQLPSIEEAGEKEAGKEAAEIFAQEPAGLSESLSAFEKSLTREETPTVTDLVASKEPEPIVIPERLETMAQVESEEPEPVVVPEHVETMAQVERHEPIVVPEHVETMAQVESKEPEPVVVPERVETMAQVESEEPGPVVDSKRVETPAQVEQHVLVPLASKRPLIARALDQLPQWLRKTILKAEAPKPSAPVISREEPATALGGEPGVPDLAAPAEQVSIPTVEPVPPIVAEPVEPEGASLPPWLEEIGQREPAQPTEPEPIRDLSVPAETLETEALRQEATMPEPLAQIPGSAPIQETGAVAGTSEAPPEESDAFPYPDWLTQLAAAPVQAERAEEITQIQAPVWVQEISGSPVAEAASIEETSAREPIAPPVAAESIPYPDWLTNLAATQPTAAIEAPPSISAEPERQIAITAPEDQALQYTSPPEPSTVAETAPSLVVEPEKQIDVVPSVEKLTVQYPEELESPAVEQERPPLVRERPAQTEIPAWLQEIEASQKSETLSADITTPAALADKTSYPDWLVNLPVPGTAQASPANVMPVESETTALPEYMDNLAGPPRETFTTVPAPTGPEPDKVALPAWLSEMSVPESKRETTPVQVTPSAPDKDVPDWLKTLSTKEVTETAAPHAPEPEQETLPRAGRPASTKLDVEGALRRARALAETPNLSGAVKEYEYILHRAPSALHDIISDLEQILTLPKFPHSVHRVLGDAYSLAGRYKESVEQYRQVIGRWQR